MNSRRLFLLTIVLVLPSLLFARGGQETGSTKDSAGRPLLVIRVAHTHTEMGLNYRGTEKFKSLVESRSAGRIKVENFGGGQLGGDRDIQEGVSLGTIEAGLSSSAATVLNDYFNLLDIPYLFVNRDHVTRVLDGDIGKRIAAPLEQKNIKHLGYLENGFRHITNNIRPIFSPDDLSGIRLRTPQSPVRMQFFKLMGANPMPLPFTELFSALQQGVVDGQENPISTAYQASFQEVQKFLSLSSHIYSPVHLLMNKTKYDALPADLQKVVAQAGVEAALWTRTEGKADDDKLVDAFKAAGVKVNDVKMDSFVAKARGTWKDIIAGVKQPDAAAIVEQIVAMAK